MLETLRADFSRLPDLLAGGAAEPAPRPVPRLPDIPALRPEPVLAVGEPEPAQLGLF
jgi:hypothetical protein